MWGILLTWPNIDFVRPKPCCERLLHASVALDVRNNLFTTYHIYIIDLFKAVSLGTGKFIPNAHKLFSIYHILTPHGSTMRHSYACSSRHTHGHTQIPPIPFATTPAECDKQVEFILFKSKAGA